MAFRDTVDAHTESPVSNGGIVMSELRDYLKEQLKAPEFVAEYEKLRPKYEASAPSSAHVWKAR